LSQFRRKHIHVELGQTRAVTLEITRGLFYRLETDLRYVNIVANDEANEQCRRNLRLTDPRMDKKRIEATKDDLLEDSCAWIFDDPDFLDWLNCEDSRTLWISGDPGKGKTMMMIDLVSKLPGRLKPNPGSTLLSYFFCQSTVPELSLRHVRKRYDATGVPLFEGPNALYASWEILSDISNDPSLTGIYLMIDALDECDYGLDWQSSSS
jgi:hypothetical protein